MKNQIPEDAKKKLDSLFEAFSIVAEGTYVYLCDMEYDCSRWSKAAVETFGLPSEYMYVAGEIWEEHIHPEDRASYHDSIEAIFSGRDMGHDMQYRAKKATGEYVVCTCRGVVIRDEYKRPKYFGGAIRNHGIYGDIDSLTGLRNQYGFFEDLKGYISRTCEVSICMVGIGKFTEINEMYGYHFGNRVLQRFGRLLLEWVGNRGCVYRLDGTKFAVISNVQTNREMADRYELFRTLLRKGLEVDEHFLIPHLNGGLLRLENFDVDDQTVYSCLNFAYGESKIRRQGDLVEFYNDLNSEDKNRLEKLQEIRNSIAQNNKGFYLLYQPVVDAKSEKLVGAEALLRWKNEKYGVVPPDHFIPVLERDPMFIPLGCWVLKQAMEDAGKILQYCPDFVINVNLSYTQLEKSDFLNMVRELLEETGFPPENLCLEITERCKLLDISLLKTILSNLQAKGIRFALDDFGTGFSSLGIAKKLQFDTIKIDRSFVTDIVQDEKERELMGHFTAFASTFGSKVCVEGIETAGMRDILQNYRVSSFQGYYYSKPIPIESLLESKFVRG